MRIAIKAKDGPLTRELLRTPGAFGLGQVPHGAVPDATTSLVCGFCSTGCSLDVHRQGDVAVNITPTVKYPVNMGKACPKGWEALAPMEAEDRAKTPLVRDHHGHLVATSWEVAANEFVNRAKALMREHGPQSVAFLGTGQITTEELALLGTVAKFGMGMVHGDGNTRQCMATSVVAYKQSFGFDAPPYTYADFEASDVIVLVGSNLCVTHPIMWERVMQNPHAPEIIVIDPRTTETATAASRHHALLPKSDLVLFYGLARECIANDWVDATFVDAHTVGYDEFVEHVQPFTLDVVARETGLTHDAIGALARSIGTGERVSLWWTMGVNQSHQGVATAQAIIDLALLTGNIGRPGTGANSITGQCNAMGSRLFANTTSLLGGREFANAEHREEVAAILDIDTALIPQQPCWSYDKIVDGISTGVIKGLWIIATNSAHSWINHGDLHELLGRLDLLVVQDLYADTETARRADIVLPAAGWAEKEGTFINSERRFGMVKRVRHAPGQALSDFSIIRLLAKAWGCDDVVRDWTSPEAVFRVLQRLSADRPCDFTGIDGYRDLDDAGGIQWPYPAIALGVTPVPVSTANSADGDERRLFEDGIFFHADGRARFIVAEPMRPLERPDADYPYVLLTGRGSAGQWHTETRTGRSAVLRSLSPDDPHVQINPADAAAQNVAPHEWVQVASRRGAMRARAFVTTTVQAGQVFMTMHNALVNGLTFGEFDPQSRQPSYKYCAVNVRKLQGWER